MRARLVTMSLEMRQALGLHLWSIYPVKEIVVYASGWKYPRETKWVYCYRNNKEIRFLWYEVEIIN